MEGPGPWRGGPGLRLRGPFEGGQGQAESGRAGVRSQATSRDRGGLRLASRLLPPADVSRCPAVVYTRRRPEETTLYQVVADNLATLYGAVDDGAVRIALPRFVRKELDGYLDCGLLCRGFARLRCDGCLETRLVAFTCKGRGFCPSCLGRKMAATAAHLIEDVLPAGAPLRQWVLTVPFAWRRRLGYDGALLLALTRLFVKTVLDFYRERCGSGQSGAVVAVQRTSSDLKLNPHVHAVFLDGGYRAEAEDGPRWSSTRSPT